MHLYKQNDNKSVINQSIQSQIAMVKTILWYFSIMFFFRARCQQQSHARLHNIFRRNMGLSYVAHVTSNASY